jgi:hypothetical protein
MFATRIEKLVNAELWWVVVGVLSAVALQFLSR